MNSLDSVLIQKQHMWKKEKKLKKKKKEKEKKVKRTQTHTDKTNREHGVQTSVENNTEWRNEDFFFLTRAPRAIFPLTLRKGV